MTDRPARPAPITPGQGLYIGLMSGTSLDAIDGALVRWTDDRPTTLAFETEPIATELRADLMALQAPGENELHRAAIARIALTDAYARICLRLLKHVPGPAAGAVIGAHGQTIRHRPEWAYTMQLLDGARLAERAGLAVVCDFRSADVAAGGQGAPLVPAFHAAVFSSPVQRRAIVNLGGIANVSLLGTDGSVSGFDTGPANVLLDLWASRVLGTPIDLDGRLAASGQVNSRLLSRLLTEPYFDAPPPKSTGRDLFSPRWLDAHLGEHTAVHAEHPSAADVQATLVELTAITVARACADFGASATYLCGGGASNPVLRARIAHWCAPAPVLTTDDLGAPPQAVEAVAFAWLARARMLGYPGNLPAVTGAIGPRVLGALYPAPPSA